MVSERPITVPLAHDFLSSRSIQPFLHLHIAWTPCFSHIWEQLPFAVHGSTKNIQFNSSGFKGAREICHSKLIGSLRNEEVADLRDHSYPHHVVEYVCLRKGAEVVRSMDELIY